MRTRRTAIWAATLLAAPTLSVATGIVAAQPVGAVCVSSSTAPPPPYQLAYCTNPGPWDQLLGQAPPPPPPPPTPTPTICTGNPPHGCNGQQLALGASCDANWAYIRGTNQDNNYVSQWFLVPAAVPENGCQPPSPSYDSGWWWKGTTQIDGYWQQGSGYAGTVNANVPAYQDSSVWWFVRMP